MTISYQRDVASSTAGGFTRLLFKWKGSLYKLIYRELLLFLTAFILLSLVYRQLLTKHQKHGSLFTSANLLTLVLMTKRIKRARYFFEQTVQASARTYHLFNKFLRLFSKYDLSYLNLYIRAGQS